MNFTLNFYLEAVYSKNIFYLTQIIFHHTTIIMRQLLFTILVCCICVIASFGQPKPEDSAASDQKFYFPYSFYNDQVALDKAIPALAEKVLNNFSADNKKDWQKQADYYALAHNFKSSLTAIDSFRKKKDDNSGGWHSEVMISP